MTPTVEKFSLTHLSTLHHDLLEWWRQTGRVLPWRSRQTGVHIFTEQKQDFSVLGVRDQVFASYFASYQRDPYRIVVAELMLQQTQVERVLPKYEAWMMRWPTIADLAHATLAEVLTFWQGLGYNRRARFLWLLAKEIAVEKRGMWPEIESELLELPGIGKYTARALLSFAFHKQAGVVDTNVKRILARVFDQDLKEKEWFELADRVLPVGQADPWNQAMMDLGALICTARQPKCDRCPISKHCLANQKAQAAGFANYAAELATLAKIKAPAKKKTVRFENTDRYFRGRIIDLLRVRAMSEQELAKELEERYGLIDNKRFQILLDKLAKEGLLRRAGNQCAIG